MHTAHTLRSRLRAALLCATALVGCTEGPASGPLAGQPGSAAPIALRGQERLALLRVVAEDPAGNRHARPADRWWRCLSFGMSAFGEARDAGDLAPPPAGAALSEAAPPAQASWRMLEGRASQAGAGDWWLAVAATPGRYRLDLRETCSEAARPLTLTVTLPAGQAPVLLGTARLVCDGASGFGGGGRSCTLAQGAPITPSEAEAVFPGTGTPVAAVPLAFPPPLAALGLPPPVAPQIRVDARDWVSAIDWAAFRRGGRPVPLSEAIPPGGLQPIPVTDWNAAAGGGGAILALGVVAAIALVFLAAKGVQAAVEANERQQTARTASQWGPCATAMAATLSPDNVAAHLRATVPTATTPLPGAEWSVSLPRLVMRRCGPAGHYGVEVASRWQARVPGQPGAAYDATFSRTVAGALEDPRLTYPTRPAWEAAVPGEAPCRPFARFCAADGAAVLLEDVAAAVTGARDAIAATR